MTIDPPAIDESQPTFQVELRPDHAEIRSGEVMDVNGATQPAVWLQGRGRRMHADNEPVEISMFMDPEQAERIGIGLIKETGMVELTEHLPRLPPETEHG